MSKVKGFIYGGISSATYGLIPLFALPVLAEGVHFNSILFYRFSVAVTAIATIMAMRKESFRIRPKELLMLVILGALFASSAMFLFWSYRLMAAGIASTILFLYPVFVAILMSSLFKEKITWLTSVAIGIALVGVAMLYMGDGGGKISLAGIIIVLLSALTYALYIIIINKSNVQHFSGLKLTFYSMLVAMALFFVKAQCSGGLQSLPGAASIVNVVLLGLIPTVVSCVTMVYSVQYIGSTYTAVLGALEPLTAVCIGVLVFREPFTVSLAFGIFFIILSVTMIIMSGIILNGLARLRLLFKTYLPGK